MTTRSASARAKATKATKTAKTAGGRHHLRVVRSKRNGLIKRSTSRRIAPMLVLGSILVIATVFAVLLEQVVLAQTGFKMDTLRREIASAETEHARLVLKVAKLSSKERIEQVAMEELGMVQPKRISYIVANVKTRGSDFLAQEQTPELLPGSGTAAGELGGVSP
ncbi:MAG: cell division protein FtsL [Actinomycetota bacterium]